MYGDGEARKVLNREFVREARRFVVGVAMLAGLRTRTRDFQGSAPQILVVTAARSKNAFGRKTFKVAPVGRPAD